MVAAFGQPGAEVRVEATVGREPVAETLDVRVRAGLILEVEAALASGGSSVTCLHLQTLGDGLHGGLIIGLHLPVREVDVDFGGAQSGVTQKALDGGDWHVGFSQVAAKRVSAMPSSA